MVDGRRIGKVKSCPGKRGRMTLQRCGTASRRRRRRDPIFVGTRHAPRGRTKPIVLLTRAGISRVPAKHEVDGCVAVVVRCRACKKCAIGGSRWAAGHRGGAGKRGSRAQRTAQQYTHSIHESSWEQYLQYSQVKQSTPTTDHVQKHSQHRR